MEQGPQLNDHYKASCPVNPLKAPFDYLEGISVCHETCPYYDRLTEWRTEANRQKMASKENDQDGTYVMSNELKASYPGNPLCCIYDETSNKTLVVTDRNPHEAFANAGHNAKSIFEQYMATTGDNLKGCTPGFLTFLFGYDPSKPPIANVPHAGFGEWLGDHGRDKVIEEKDDSAPDWNHLESDQAKTDYALLNRFTRELIAEEMIEMKDRYSTNPMPILTNDQIDEICSQGRQMLGKLTNGIAQSNLYVTGMNIASMSKGPNGNPNNKTMEVFVEFQRGPNKLYCRENLAASTVNETNLPPSTSGGSSYESTNWFHVVGGLGASEIGICGNVILDDETRDLKNQDYKRVQQNRDERNGNTAPGKKKQTEENSDTVKHYVQRVATGDNGDGATGKISYRVKMHTRNQLGTSYLATTCALKGVVLLVNSIATQYLQFFCHPKSDKCVDMSLYKGDRMKNYHQLLTKKITLKIWRYVRAHPDWMKEGCVCLAHQLRITRPLTVFTRRFMSANSAAVCLADDKRNKKEIAQLKDLISLLEKKITEAKGKSRRPGKLMILPAVWADKANMWEKKIPSDIELAIVKVLVEFAVSHNDASQFESSEDRWQLPFVLADVPAIPIIKQYNSPNGTVSKFAVDLAYQEKCLPPSIRMYSRSSIGVDVNSAEYLNMWRPEVLESTNLDDIL